MRYLIIITVIALAVFLSFPRLDLAVSGYFYLPGEGFPWMEHPVTMAMYYLVRLLTWGTAVGLIFMGMARWRKIPVKVPFSGRQIAYLLIALTLGPGILVHWGVKEYFGRARPLHVMEFGGEQSYTPPFVVSDAGEKSFVSGHAAMGFYFTAFGLVAAGKRRKQFYAGGLAFGTLASLARVMQGKHFLSDVLFAALLVLLLNHALYWWMFRKSAAPAAHEHSPARTE